jgi:hypothetical protein
LYIGNLRDSGWGAGRNTGSIVRLRPTGSLPAGIAEVRAQADGFLICFTQPVDRRRAGDPAAYSISSYRRTATPAYGGPDQDRRLERIESALVADDGRSVELRLSELRAGHVYEVRVRRLVARGEWFPAEAHYTMRRTPVSALKADEDAK